MRLYYAMMIALVWIIISCNKKKDDQPVKSVGELVKGKAWSGDIRYATDWANQPFYVEFNSSDNKFIWAEARGVYGGIYTIDEAKRELKMTFDGSGKIVTITLTKEEKVLGINYGGAYGWMLENVEQNNSAGDILDNTSWKGTKFADGVGPDNNYSIKFNSGTTVTPIGSSGYLYSRSGSVIRSTMSLYNVFMVVNKDKITGIWIFNLNSKFTNRVDLKKQ